MCNRERNLPGTSEEQRSQCTTTQQLRSLLGEATAVDAVGVGPDEPLPGLDPDSAEGRRMNRRVEITLFKSSAS